MKGCALQHCATAYFVLFVVLEFSILSSQIFWSILGHTWSFGVSYYSGWHICLLKWGFVSIVDGSEQWLGIVWSGTNVCWFAPWKHDLASRCVSSGDWRRTRAHSVGGTLVSSDRGNGSAVHILKAGMRIICEIKNILLSGDKKTDEILAES